MPFHCQKKAIFEANKLPWEDEKPESPNNVTGEPGGQAIHSAGDQPVNLTATKKPDDDNHKGSPVNPASIPNNSGKNFKQDEEDGKVSFGAGAGVGVEIRGDDPPPLTVPGFDTSKSGNENGPKLGKGVPENLKDLVLALGNFKKCSEVFEQIIQTSNNKYKEWKKKSQNGKSIFETVYDSLKSVKINLKITSKGGNAGGHITFKDDLNNDNRGIIGAYSRFAMLTIQEMIHQVFNDADLLKASQTLINSGNLDPMIKGRVDSMIKSNEGKLYEHHVLGQACSINDLELGDFSNGTRFSVSPFSDPYWNYLE